MNKLEGKIALNTGGNSGIGLATARQFVNEGAYVFITGRREPELNDAVKQIGRSVSPADNPKVERNVRAFLKALNSGGGQPIETLSPADARQVLVGVQASVKLELPPCEIEDRTITQDGIDVPITIVRPAGLKEKGPVFMFFHGGGWILGDFPTHERFVRDLVADSGPATTSCGTKRGRATCYSDA